MSRSGPFFALLLGGTALTSLPAMAQETTTPPAGETVAQPAADAPAEPEVEVSTPGGDGADIVVTGRYIPEPVRNTAQVVNVISAAEIARTGDGDISGALQRVTGLSVNTNGFVYVRGLGDRYSLALLNGLPLPSPEPLRRVVPLDVFPTSIVSSALVQKSYSVNFPGEYGGGVINLTTASLPDENYLTIGAGISGDSETTAKLGYTYNGSKRDIIGYDDGKRDLPAALRDNNGALVSASALENEDTLILQRNRDIPANFSASLAGGYSTDFGDTRFGVLGSASFSNAWKTRGALQQVASAGSLNNSSYGVRTENRIQANGLLAMGLDLAAGHKIRFTNVYIHDTSKVARVRGAYKFGGGINLDDVTEDDLTGPYDSLSYASNYVQRQLFTSQLVGEFEFDNLELDLRGAYANSKRKSPYERNTEYLYYGPADAYRINFNGPTNVVFSDLNEDVWAGGADLSYEFKGDFNAKFSVGYAYSDTSRVFQSLNFAYDDGGTPVLTGPNAYQPIYVLLAPYLVAQEDINLRQTNRQFGQAQYQGDLTIHGGYVRGDMELAQGLRLEAGVRYETAKQTLTLPDIYGNNPTGVGNAAVIEKKNDYWLPAATLTWNFAEDFQFRLHGSKTLARPQFRELGTIPVLDLESDRLLSGNPFLTDSQLYNAEARVEYYPARGERMSIAGFFKKIKNPIESIATVTASGELQISNANAPEASLYGVEAEVVKYFDISSLGGWFGTKQLVLSANYTYSKSELKVGADDTTTLFPGNIDNPVIAPASQVFTDGSPLTGQSKHLASLQFGIEDTEHLEQLTFLVTYASKRVTSRGANTAGVVDPDIVEKPGVNFDVVVRQGFQIEGMPELEFKVEARNLLGTKFQETQSFPSYKVRNNVYDVGTSLSASISAKF